MNKMELVKEISIQTNLSKEESQKSLETILKIITNTLQKSQAVNLIGFGSFQVKTRSARNGVNPKTGEKMHIKASKTPIFKAGKLLKDAVKNI